MALVLQQNILGRAVADPIQMDRRRRRLSSVVKRYANARRPFIVNVRKIDDPALLYEENDRLRKDWVHTLVGPEDVVAIVYLPLGGSSGGAAGAAGKPSAGKQIGSAVAMVALAVAASVLFAPAGPLIGALGLGTTGAALTSAVASAAVIAGGGYLIQRAFAAKANKAGAQDTEDRPLYGVSGGGNQPRPGDRIPRGYGKFWTNPDLSQPDYFTYSGEDQILYKRVTIGLGHYDIKQVQVGRAVLWTKEGGIQPTFFASQVEVIAPGAASTLVPHAVFSASEVGGNELQRPNQTPAYVGPFPGTPVGVTASEYQVDFSLPEGCYAEVTNSTTGAISQTASAWGINVEAAPADDNNNPIGAWFTAYTFASSPTQNTRAMRFSQLFSIPTSRYIFRFQNGLNESTGNHNKVVLDGLRAFTGYNVTRPHVTELAVKIVSGKSLGVTGFGEILVQASAIIPQRVGSTWSLVETDKAAWAFADILRGSVGGVVYGADLPDSAIDIGLIQHFASQVGPFDTFNGIIRGPVSVFEAGQTVLGAMRTEPLRIGNAWSLTRDESRNLRKHTFTRRQILRGSSKSTFTVGGGTGDSDIIAEYFFDGDPRRRRESRVTFGTSTTTPRRINLAGITNHAHATHIATWMAASNYFRRQRRSFTAELAGRLVKRNDPAFVDSWFLTEGKAYGVLSRSGRTLTLDADCPANSAYKATIRDRDNLDFGPIDFTQGASLREIVLNSSDVNALENAYGVQLQDIMATDVEDMTSILVGPVEEIREPYIIQSAIPRSRDTVAIEALHDDPRVWEALGEVAIDPGASAVGDADDAVPRIAYIYAHTVQYSSQTSVEWAVGRVRNASLIVVDLSYDNWATSERISEGMSTSGRYPLRVINVDNQGLGTAWIRAYAVNKYGLQSPYVNGVFTIWKPFITNEFASLIIHLEDLSEQVRADIEKINKIGEGTIRGALRDLEKKVNELAAASATEAGRTYESDRYVKVALEGKVGTAFAAIRHEEEVRISETEALAQTTDTLAVRIDDSEAAIVEERTARIDADEAEATARLTLKAQADDTQAALVQEQTARADGDSALAQDVTAVTTTVNGHSTTITQVQQSLNGSTGFWGVAIQSDGAAVGGFRLIGYRNADGTVFSQFGISGSLVVTGTISGAALETQNIISVSAQIGDLIVDNLHVKNFAITQMVGSSGSGQASVTVTSRGTGNWILWLYYFGEAGSYHPIGTTVGQLFLDTNGVQGDGIGFNYEASGTGDSAGFARLQTLLITGFNPGAGTFTFTARSTVGGFVRIIAQEASK
jgi:hypothetical protein